MRYTLIFLLVILAGCYEPPDLPMLVAIEHTGPIVIDLGNLFDMPDPNNPYYIREWDDPWFRIRHRDWKYRHMRQLVKGVRDGV